MEWRRLGENFVHNIFVHLSPRCILFIYLHSLHIDGGKENILIAICFEIMLIYIIIGTLFKSACFLRLSGVYLSNLAFYEKFTK